MAGRADPGQDARMARHAVFPEAPAGAATARPAVLAKGFRPFFLLSGLWAVAAMALWTLTLLGAFAPGAYLPGFLWHAHAMVFGFTTGVIAGFLLTAVANWTGRETVVGRPLGALALLWVAGRLALLWPDALPRGVPALVDLAFLPAVAVACGRPILGVGDRRNRQFVVMLAVLSLANLAVHLGALGVAPAGLRRGLVAGVDVVVVMMLVMTTRILPMFTRNATRADGIRNLPTLDRAAVGGAVLVAALDVAGLDGVPASAVAAVTGVLVLARATHWGARHVVRHPLLWVLHAGHAWIAVGLLLRGAGLLWPTVAPSLALHALTAGAIGMLTLGMMTRVGLGHTGRMLDVPPAVGGAFGAMLLAGLVRVVGPLAAPAHWTAVMATSAVCFAGAFAVYVVVYAPVLLAPRVDGRPG
jgi:uncharacterized protein involved in response to NO